jgi:hypothetical protein
VPLDQEAAMPNSTLKETIARQVKTAVAARKPMTKNLIVRVSEELYAKLEEAAAEMTKNIPGRNTTVSDIARGILEVGLKDRRPTWSSMKRAEDELEK